MTIDSLEVVFYTCVFLLPGFIVKSITDTLVPHVKHNDTKYFYSCLLYSIVNCALCSWVYILLNKISENHPIIYWILLLVTTLIGATAIGIFIGFVRQKEVIESLFKKMKIDKIHPVPNAWDYYFSKRKGNFLIITLIDDTKMYGWYSSESFSSSDYEERDIYVQKGYKFINNDWVEDNESDGFYIPKDQIKLIEFKKENDNGE